MNFDSQLLFFFSALGAFNGLLLSLYFFFFAKPKHHSNILLGGVLAALSIRIGKSVFFYFNPELSKIYLQIGLSSCFLIGPFLYFYVKSKVDTHKKVSRFWWIPPSAFILFIVIVGVLYPYSDHITLWSDSFIRIIYYQWLACIIVTTFLLKPQFKRLFQKTESLSYNDTWVLSIYVGVLLIWVAYFSASFTSYIVGAVSFSFVLYLSVLLLIHKRQGQTSKPISEKYSNQKISKPEADQLFSKIDSLIREKDLYKNPNLTLPQLATQLNMRTQLLSQFINDNLNKNFSQFINEYRITEAKRLLKANSKLKVEVIAEQCGFNSSSTFYTAFKKITNTTPSKFYGSN